MNYNAMLLGLLVVLGGCAWWIFKEHTYEKKDVLIVGTAAGYAPFVSINAQGEYEGFDIDFAKALARTMGKELVLQDLGSMTSLFAALDQGKIDCIIWGLSITQDRLKKVAMVRYQGEATTAYPLIFWKNIPSGITSLADMNNKIVCVEPGSSQEAVLRSFSSITVLPVERVDDAMLNIHYGKADAALVEPAIAQKFKNKYQEIQMLSISLSPEQQVHGVGIAVRQNNNELIQSFEQAVDKLHNDETIHQLEKKWELV